MFLRTCAVLLCVSSFAIGQTPITSSATTLSPETVLEQMIAVGGWSPMNLPSDLQLSANITMGQGGVKGATRTITFKARGTKQFRWEYSDLPGQATVANIATGAARGARNTPITAQGAQPWIAPFLGRLQDVEDGVVSLELLGTEMLGESTYKLRLRQVPSDDDPRRDEIDAGSQVILWISTNTLLPIQVEYFEQSVNNLLSFTQMTRRYRDYRRVQGVMLPFRQEVLTEGDNLYDVTITNVQFNLGLPASDFQFTTPAGGR